MITDGRAQGLMPPVSRSVVRPLVPLVRQAPLQLPPRQTVHAVLPHTACRRRSPPAFGFSRQDLLALGAITVLKHLATLTRNKIRYQRTDVEIDKLTEPTGTQRRAFDLINTTIPSTIAA
jgi:hypothetical protein